ncbi:LacI family DNA-binding transcriptional regulator [Marinovum algicola]|uniref:LacI family DNA-binding transcriptional regulator n=1 Tax=Marinovum algicola TaxID=42444 RepID=UPI0024BA49C7|nr:LacI family DNA-binding transcriptional regulator [Marinovum algicola]
MDRQTPTLSDVARRAGVSYATADRVINNRGGVAEKSVRRVRAAIEDLGYVRNVAAANLAQKRTYRFAFVIPEGPNSFFQRLRNILETARPEMLVSRVALMVESVAAFDAAALVGCLERLAEDKVDGVALVGTDDARVCAAIDALRAQGMAVLTLVADVQGARPDGYVGIDNTIAGRTAGRLLLLAHGDRGGRVLPIVGVATAHDHAERLAGMQDTLAEAGGRVTSAPLIEGRDRHDIVEAELHRRLAEDPEITAIYSAGAGNAGLVRVLARRAEGRPIVVLHELVAHSRQALESGLVDVVIDQRPEDEIQTALECLRAMADRRDLAAPAPIVPAIYLRENLPPAAVASQIGDPVHE